MKKRAAVFLAIKLLLSATAFANNGPSAETIARMRNKQEGEENSVVRVVQQPVVVHQDFVCSPVEMARQRIRDLGGKDSREIGSINLEAGHGEVDVEDNHGEINNSVNVQVVAPNDRKCF